ncbi:ABC transporter ATP-binding protein [Aestuariirhabdus litorea]|uniref:ABC transporter ATP-binding protein n=1 Tax=Aestuariirhabdus litorea TaxID=2528527 RepID=A0A3P3VRR7_9GAMM|nr:ABC transporter ATP-binding protein [Aestuariirhabdus litorea]RRJ85320.1 ABC transporter ATP-binding protein [Aestuariirhabdus litorea]RWW98542.1 ATP-binding cassette domain-containing protein [Endozoicomonadaceae bacterium GTF-13]
MVDFSPPPLLQIRGLRKAFGALEVTRGVELRIEPGEIHAIIGPNGAGKTSLINQISGELEADSGSILFAGRELRGLAVHQRARLGLGRTYQTSSLFDRMSVEHNVMLALQSREGHSFRFWRPTASDPRLINPAREILQRLDLLPLRTQRAADLAHGQRRQLEIAMALATRPKLLLLDEPMAGMGQEESWQMVEALRRLGKEVSILFVEHDMETVFALADRISVLVYGRVIACGDADSIRNDPQVRSAYLGGIEDA